MTTPALTYASPATADRVAPLRTPAWLLALRGFARGTTVATIAVSALLALDLDLGLPLILVALLLGFLGFAFLFAGEGLTVLLWKLLAVLFRLLKAERPRRMLAAVPPVPIGRIAGAFVLTAGDVLWPNSFLQHIMLPVPGEIAILLAGLAAMMVALARQPGRTRQAQLVLIASPVLLILAFAGWLLDPGFAHYLPAAPATVASPLSLPDPGLPGPYTVQTLSYGSGDSRRRPEYNAAATLLTPTVDGSRLFAGYGRLADSYVNWYWGFDFSHLPLNGLVWYPAGDGPFPLVLIVHGNHAMSVPSDPGYAYLAQHLASQGYIAVSVDENFLNGLAFFDGNFEEMPLRAWLLLQHLQQWRTWNETPGNRFQNKVDLERVALIGHSRGGEAVAWAAQLNWQPVPPVTAVARPGDFGFGIRAVVAIAPSDAYTGPGGRKPTLDHSNYLLLAGGHDADTFLLYGQQQFNRVRFRDNPGGFKALAYLYQANHGQFNTVWGNQDRGLYNSWLLNRAPLLNGAGQQQAANVLVTGFLNAALRDQDGYRAVFRQAGTAATWLQPGLAITQYQEEPFLPLDTNDGSTTLANTEVTGATAHAQDTTLARVEVLKLRDGQTNQGNKALHLGWPTGSTPAYTVTLPPEKAARWGLAPDGALTFSLAAAPSAPLPTQVWVELQSAGGQTARLALAGSAPLLPSLPAYLVKAGWLSGLNGFPGPMAPEEIVLQTYTLPLADFLATNPTLRLDQLHTLRFLFDGAAAGEIYLDEIGFTPASPSINVLAKGDS